MDTKQFDQYVADLAELGAEPEVLEFIQSVYGVSDQAVELLNGAAWYYVGCRDADQVSDYLMECYRDEVRHNGGI